MTSPVIDPQPSWVRSNAISLISLLVALIAIGLAVWFFFLQEEATSLTLQITSHTNLVSPEARGSDKVTVLFEDREIPELWLATFRLLNDGDVPVRPDDFAEAIKMVLGSGEIAEILNGDTVPSGLRAKFTLAGVNEVHSAPLLLNKGDSVTFSLFATESMERLSVTSRIAGVPEIKLVSLADQDVGDKVLVRNQAWFLVGVIFMSVVTSAVLFMRISRMQAREDRLTRILDQLIERSYPAPTGDTPDDSS